MISIIAAIGQNYELGKANQLVFHIKEDMQFFKSTTLGHPIIMGSKTYESIGRPLPGRDNYIASRSNDPAPAGTKTIHDLVAFLKEHEADSTEYFVIGGATIYKLALPYAKNLYLTEINATAPNADAFFPAFDHAQYAREVIRKGKENDLTYSFVKYIKK